METINTYKGLNLDKYQVESFKHLKEQHSIIVSAPTGSGKTLIVEYAIDLALEAGKKVIYTSPIKALSNQKYRDFSKDYGSDNIGIITGDITLNRDAPVIIMTTEILRNMLYSDTEDPYLDDLMFVIFDEIHYLNNPQRGVIWEESLILIPKEIPIVLLSATIPNADEIKSWLEQIKLKTFHLITHAHRSVPIQHYYFDGTLHKIKDEIHISQQKTQQIYRKLEKQRRLGSKYSKLVYGNDIFSPVEMVQQIPDSFFPAIYFIFSRKACEKAAQYVARHNRNLLNPKEVKLIRDHISTYKAELNAVEDLKQIKLALDLVHKGVAFHHAGCVPIIKEVIETLFAKGLVKILFTTETFAMGLNLPAKTVVFHALQKFDGESFRMMTVGEFQQMSGRAGRRGIDKIGNAIIVLDFEIEEEEVLNLIKGDPEPLESQFRLSYNAICNLLQTYESQEIISLLKSSLKEYSAEKIREKKNIALQNQQSNLEKKIAVGIQCPKGFDNPQNAVDEIEKYLLMDRENQSFKKLIRVDFSTPEKKEIMNLVWEKIIPRGKIVQLAISEYENPMLGVILRQYRESEIMDANQFFTVAILLENGYVQECLPEDYEIYSLIYPFEQLPKGKIKDQQNLVNKVFQEIRSNVDQAIEKELIAKPQNAEKIIRKKLKDHNISIIEQIPINELEEKIELFENHLCHNCEYFQEHRKRYRYLTNLTKKQDRINRQIVESQNLSYEAFKRMTGVLNNAGFIDNDGLLEKGYLLAHIHHENDILIAEAIAQGLFSLLPFSELVAIFAMFSLGKKDRGFEKVPFVRKKNLKKIFRSLQKNDATLSHYEKRNKVPLIHINRSFSMRFVEIARLWSEGYDLDDIRRSTVSTMSEGDIVNTLRRVLNLMTQTRIILEKLDFDVSLQVLDEAIQSLRRSHVIPLLNKDFSIDNKINNNYIEEQDDRDYSIPSLR